MLYVDISLVAEVEKLMRAGGYLFDAKKYEVAEKILRYGLNNKAEILRELRELVAEGSGQ